MKENITEPMELMKQPVLLENPDGRITYTSKRALETFGDLKNSQIPYRFSEFFRPFGRDPSALYLYRSSGRLYSCAEECLPLDGRSYRKIVLSPFGECPDETILRSYKLMAEKLVHQFRSPLTSVQGFSEMLAGGKLPGPAAKKLEKIGMGLARTFELIDRIESFVRPVTVENTDFTSRHLFRSAMEAFDPEVRGRILVRGQEEISMNSDFFLLRTILVELLKNALEASAGKSSEEVELSGGDSFIEVSNSLPEPAAAHLEDIFLPFFSTKALQMGLGLPTSQRYCRQLGLDLQVYFDPDRNTIRFRVTG